MNETMQAVQMAAAGPPDVLKVQRIRKPSCGPHDVIIRVAGCGIDRHDLLTRNGTIRRKSRAYRASAASVRDDIDLPLVLGGEIAGEIAEIGNHVRGLVLGDRVACLPMTGHCGHCQYCQTGRLESCTSLELLGHDIDGGYAQFVRVTATGVAKVPDNVSLVDASISSACIATVVRAVRDDAALRMGETALITGASGGLGVHATQLAKLAGARVIALTSTAEKAAGLKELGADEVIVAERGQDWSKEVLQATSGNGVDVAIDLVGVAVFPSVLQCMALYGRIVITGEVGGGSVPFRPAMALLRRLQLLASYSPGVAQLTTALKLLAAGKIRAVIDSTLPMSQASIGHARMEQGNVFGRIVLVPDGEWSHD